jgi:hypothetical protein
VSSRSPSPAPDDAEAQDARARLGKLLNLDGLIAMQDTAVQDNDPPQPEDDDEEQEFEFRLFSAPAKSTENATKGSEKDVEANSTGKSQKKSTGTDTQPSTVTQKLRIRLRSPSPGAGGSEGRFVKASRGWDYYFSTPSLLGTRNSDVSSEDEDTIAEKKQQYQDMAVTGEHMLTWAQSQAWVSPFRPMMDLTYTSHISGLVILLSLTRSIARLPSALASDPSKTPSDETSTASW